jgi:hypothetical protein
VGKKNQMAEIIQTMGGTLTYTAGNHRYAWNGERVDLSVSGVASSFPLNFGAASGWAAKIIREELVNQFDDRKMVEPKPLGQREDVDRRDRAAGCISHIFNDVAGWAKDICAAPRRATKRAADIGTAVHNYVERLALGQEPNLNEDEDIALCQRHLGDWFKQNIKEVIDVERRLYSEKWKIAGTCDMTARLYNDEIHVLDWKGVTALSASLKAGHCAQLTAYRSMLEEAGERIDGCTLVRFSRKTGEVDPVTFKHHEENLAAFEAALLLARYEPRAETF